MKVLSKKLKRTPSARKILQDSIADIDAGLWVCGDLMRPCPINGTQKPMGCALGLVGINSRQYDVKTKMSWITDPSSFIRKKAEVAYASIRYPSLRSPKSVLKAVELLAETTKLSDATMEDILTSYDTSKARDRLMLQEEVITTYNDTGASYQRLAPSDAKAWFQRALAKLDEK